MLADEEGEFDYLRAFNGEIDRWQMVWHARQENNLYSYFAKLRLNSLATRGVSLSTRHLSTQRKEFMSLAISAATSILTFLLEEEGLRRALVGTPLYVHTMIAFASAVLMKGDDHVEPRHGAAYRGGLLRQKSTRARSLAAADVGGLPIDTSCTTSGVTMMQGSRPPAMSTGNSVRDDGQFVSKRFPTDGHYVEFSNEKRGAENTGTVSFGDEFSYVRFSGAALQIMPRCLRPADESTTYQMQMARPNIT